jgi:hypothetical protein
VCMEKFKNAAATIVVNQTADIEGKKGNVVSHHWKYTKYRQINH